MVNEFVPLSPKKRDDEDCYYQESSEKPLVSESSDEETTSSSLMPIPDTLDVMRDELKNTIDNFGTTDYVETPKKNLALKNLNLDTKKPSEREVSIANKITSAHLILDDLLSSSNTLPKSMKKKNPLVFAAKPTRKRLSSPASEISDPSTGFTSSSCEHQCPMIPVATIGYPPKFCDFALYPTGGPDPGSKSVAGKSRTSTEVKKREMKNFLLDKVNFMRMQLKRAKRSGPVNESQQTEPAGSIHGLYTYLPTELYIPELAVRKSKKDECTEVRDVKDAKCGDDEPIATQANEDGVHIPTVDRSKAKVTVASSFPVKPKSGRDRIDFYYFDHGNSLYYKTTDSHRAKLTENILDKTEEYTSKFWAEVFGTVTIATAFVVSFILQLYRCVFVSIIRGLTVGLIQIYSDYFFKPLLAVIFNGLIQPCLILGYNVATSMRDFCVPVCEICEFCAKDLAIIFGSCRIVEVRHGENSSPTCSCRHNV